MTDVLLGLASLAPVSLAGCLVLLTLDRDQLLGPIETVTLGYGIGTGFLIWEMLLFQRLGLSFTTARLLVPLVGISVLIFLVARPGTMRREHRSQKEVYGSGSLSPLEWLLITATAMEVSGAFFRAWFLPMEAYDAVSNWGLKAKAIFLARSIPEGFLQNPNYEVFHPDYPLLVPLLESFVYGFAKDLREPSAKVVFPLFMVGGLAVLFAVLRRTGQTRRASLLFTFLLASIPYFSEQATNGYADVVLSFYFGAGSLYLFLWQTTGRGLFLAVSAMLAACGALTKNEGLVLGGILLTWVAVVSWSRSAATLRQRLVSLSLYCCFLAAALMPWYLFRSTLGLRNDVVNANAFITGLNWTNLSRLGPILYHLQTQVFGPKNWNWVWVLLGLAIGLRRDVLLRPPAVFLLGAVALTVAAYMIVYLITPYTIPPFDVAWHLRTSASRLLTHVLLQVVFLIGCAFSEREKA